MDPLPNPFIGKTKPPGPRIAHKLDDKAKITAHESQISRERRVFGTDRSTNIVGKTTISAKQMTKTSNPKSTKPKNHVKNPIKSRFKEEIKTPLVIKSELVETPYYNAKKSGFDKLESASYWVDQIKLAESVGKHFVSVAFFRLAFDSNAQPKRKLCFELEQYLRRHKHLSTQLEWKDLSLTSGILKDESKREKSGCGDFDNDQMDLNEKISGADQKNFSKLCCRFSSSLCCVSFRDSCLSEQKKT